MGIEYTMRAVCDRCGIEIRTPRQVPKGQIDDRRRLWEEEWKDEGVLVGLPSRYGKRSLHCRKCAGT